MSGVRTGLGLAAMLASACAPSGDPLLIQYTFATSGEESCGSDAMCTAIPMTCDAIALLRIVDPDKPETVHLDRCVELSTTREDLCPLSEAAFNVDVMATIPTGLVEVQLAIYKRSDLAVPGTDDFTCPDAVAFTATGFASPDNSIQPALAGRAFADGYDSEVTIELGCHDIGLINTNVCRDENEIDLTASVLDFDTTMPLSLSSAGMHSVRVGEPRQSDLEWVIDTARTVELELQDSGPPPSWLARDVVIGTGPGEVSFVAHACVQVLQDIPQATATLTCRPTMAPLPDALDLTGVRVRTTTLSAVLAALGLTALPSSGLVIGIVVDEIGAPVAGVTVSDSELPSSQVLYLSADRTSTAGLTQTTTSGIFTSQNAPLMLMTINNRSNEWTAVHPTLSQRTFPAGGIVVNRVTVVVIQLEP